MILGASDHERFESVFSGDASKKGPEFRLDLRRNQIPAQLSGEHAMHEIGDVRV
jgi:hypothetical protein